MTKPALSITPTRRDVLAAVVDGTLDRPDAREKRALTELAEVGYVRIAEGVYEATLDGRMVRQLAKGWCA